MNPSTFRSNLTTAYAARANVSALGAAVFQYPPGNKATLVPTLFLNTVASVDQEDFTLVGDISKIYQITGGGYAPGAGAAESSWGTAESNAWTLIDELNDQLESDETVGGACNHSRVTSWNLTPSVDDQGRIFSDFEFTITAWVWP